MLTIRSIKIFFALVVLLAAVAIIFHYNQG